MPKSIFFCERKMTPPNSQTPQADVMSAEDYANIMEQCFEYEKLHSIPFWKDSWVESLRIHEAAIRQSERAKITAIIEERIGTYTRKHEIEGGSQETKAEQRFAIEVLERLKSQFQTPEGV